MKNIHVLPTDKPSRLHFFYEVALTITSEYKNSACDTEVNIYITSDEEIKEDDWFTENGINTLLQWRINKWKMSYSFPSEMNDICKKIILTTDQDLIKNGVQAIDDNFLEWFVNNPSCEEVEIEKWTDYKFQNNKEIVFFNYKIIIPKEEPKQETLEEAAKRTYQKGLKDDIDLSFYDGVRLGSKWQAERRYSEEEVIDFLQEMNDWSTTFEGRIDIREWFEQFKKKGGDK
jgi:hypothetical protein